MRKLASIQEIAEVKSIKDAYKICAYRINGWWIVDQVNKYSVGDKVIYLETDSWVPTSLAPFLSKGKEPRLYQNISGERLRTIKLRGQISQGLILPISMYNTDSELYIGLDVSEELGIIKWEVTLPTQLVGLARGLFPEFIHKTDQERVQNVPEVFLDTETAYEVTIKLDGSSHTSYVKNGVFGVCSRNIDLKDGDNAFWNAAKFYNLDTILPKLNRNLAVQCEMIGPGIQGNPEQLSNIQLYVFDIFDIDTGRYLSSDDRYDVILKLNSLGSFLSNAPHIGWFTLKDFNMESLLKYADGYSLNTKVKREGLIFKSLDGTKSFKVISNAWLLKEK